MIKLLAIMNLSRGRTSRRGALAAAAVLAAWATTAVAAGGARPGGAGGTAGAHGSGGRGGHDVLAPARLRAGPSLTATGKIGAPPPLEGEVPPSTLRAHLKLKTRPEPDVTPPETRPHVAPAQVVPRALKREITARLGALPACQDDVALGQHVPVGRIRAGSAVLRWTIEHDGTVSGAEVVEKTPVDPDVMECMKRTIEAWTFHVPAQGPVHVERTYQFPARR